MSGPLVKNAGGSFTCHVDVELDGLRLPEPGWIDFIEILLWWWERLHEYGHRQLLFMDGPFEMHLDGDGEDVTPITFERRTLRGNVVVMQAMISEAQFRCSVFEACRSVADLLRDAGERNEAERFDPPP